MFEKNLQSRILQLRHELIFCAIALAACPAAGAEARKYVTEHIVVNTPPEYVFHAIRKMRDQDRYGRKTLTYDGKVATVDEQMHGVAIYGNVHCVWQESEKPYESIEYKILSSDHFKSASGRYILTPSADNKTTSVEVSTTMDSGLRIPLGDNITRMNVAKDSKERLARMKQAAETDFKDGVKPVAPPIK